jgi:hypothetical protein
MNYIKKLEEENSALKDAAYLSMIELTDLYVYLTSSKFYDDTTVQVSDVMRRTEQLRALINTSNNIGA